MKRENQIFVALSFILFLSLVLVIPTSIGNAQGETVDITFCRDGVTVQETLNVTAPLSADQVYQLRANDLMVDGYPLEPCQLSYAD